jgi:rhodanese-related sulfurtransferase
MRLMVTMIALLFLTLPSLAADQKGPRAVHAAVAAGTMTLIDIRRPDEWQATGSAKGALRMSMLSPDFAARIKALQAAKPGQRIALICQAGVRSARLAKNLEAQGLTGLVDVIGGTQLWIDQGLPLTR